MLPQAVRQEHSEHGRGVKGQRPSTLIPSVKKMLDELDLVWLDVDNVMLISYLVTV
jgi:hypothetical protein